VGKVLDTPQNETFVEITFSQIKELINSQTVARIRFMLMDITDLKNSKWIPRREEAKARKIDEVHQEAQQEEARKAAALRSGSNRSSGSGKGLPSLSQQRGPGTKSDQADISKVGFSHLKDSSKSTEPRKFIPGSFVRVRPPSTHADMPKSPAGKDLLPGPKDGAPSSPRGSPPPAEPAQPAQPVQSVQPVQPVQSVQPAQSAMDEEKFDSVVQNNLDEYWTTKSLDDAASYFEVLKSRREWFPKIVAKVLDAASDSKKEKSANQLLAFLFGKGLLSLDDLAQGFESMLSTLDDLCYDVPNAPNVLGRAFAVMVQEAHLGKDLFSKVPSLKLPEAHPKVAATLLKTLVAAQGEVPTASFVSSLGGFSALVSLSGDELHQWIEANVSEYFFFFIFIFIFILFF